MDIPYVIGDTFDMSLGSNRATRTLRVRLPEQDRGNYAAALNAADIPALKSVHPLNKLLLVQDITVEPIHPGNPDEAKVILTYTVPSNDSDSYSYKPEDIEDPATPPWERPAVYLLSSVKRDIPTDQYYTDDGALYPNTNSAGDLISPQMMRLEALRVITVKKCYPATQSPSWGDALIGTVNSNELSILGRTGKHCFFLDDADYELRYWYDPEKEKEVPYYQSTLVIQYNPKGFAVQQLDMGYRERNENGNLATILDANDNIPVRPLKLDGNGCAMDWESQANPHMFALLPPRHFYRPAEWAIPSLPQAENFR